MSDEIKYNYLEKISVAEALDGKMRPWFNQTLCRVGESVLRVGVFLGEYPMHKHDLEDEAFFVLEGEIVLETAAGRTELSQYEGICIPKGTMHRPIAEKQAIVLMMEPAGVRPEGD